MDFLYNWFMPASKRIILSFSLVLLLFVGVRWAATFTRAFWYDEAFSILISQTGPEGIIAGTLNSDNSSSAPDIHPPAYYFLLYAWIQLFGTSIAAARALSILLGGGGFLLIYFLAREIADQRTALLAGLLMALSPFQVQYTTEIRMYALLECALLLTTFAMLKGAKTGRWYWWVVFSVAAAVAQYTHNLAAFYLLPLALTSLFARNRKIIFHTLLAGMGAIILYIPWLIHVPSQFTTVQQHYWVTRPTLIAFIDLALRYVPNLPLPDAWLLPGLFIAFICSMLVLFQTLKVAVKKAGDYRVGLWLGFLAIFPPVLLWAFSQWTPVYLDRALLTSQAVFCVWFAWTLSSTSMPKVIKGSVAVLLTIGFGMGLRQACTYNGYGMDGLKAVSAVLADQLEPGDVVVHSNKLTYLPLFYYDKTLPMTYVTDTPGSSTDTLLPATREVLGVHDVPDIQSAAEGVNRMWFVILQESVDEYIDAGYSTHDHLRYLEEEFDLISTQTYADVVLFQFERKAQ